MAGPASRWGGKRKKHWPCSARHDDVAIRESACETDSGRERMSCSRMSAQASKHAHSSLSSQGGQVGIFGARWRRHKKPICVILQHRRSRVF
jgi:hypothetical protein